MYNRVKRDNSTLEERYDKICITGIKSGHDNVLFHLVRKYIDRKFTN